MKIVPVIKSSDLQRSLHFYTVVLDFDRKWPGYEDREMANGVIFASTGGFGHLWFYRFASLA